MTGNQPTVVKPDWHHFRSVHLKRLPRALRAGFVVAFGTVVWAVISTLTRPGELAGLIGPLLLVLKVVLVVAWSLLSLLLLLVAWLLVALRGNRLEAGEGRLTHWELFRPRSQLALSDAVRVHRVLGRTGQPADVVEAPSGKVGMILSRSVYGTRLDHLWHDLGLEMVGAYSEKLDLQRPE